jgi:hypothetical protein
VLAAVISCASLSLKDLRTIRVDLRLSDLRLSDVPFYPTCRVGPEKADRMSHIEGLNSIQTAFHYVEQQMEASATDILT